MSLPRPGSIGAWLLAARPKTLPAAIAPVVVGTAVAHASGGVKLGPALCAGLGAIFLQIASNFANDVFDHEKGADTEERLGPTRAVQAGLLSAAAVRRGLAAVLLAALACGVYLVATSGWPIVVLGVLAMICAVAYTGGPYPLGYHGLGDVLVMVFFGFAAVCGTAYVQLGYVPQAALWSSYPIGALATAILVVNNLRDHIGDAAAGKRTLAVRLGPSGARLEYAALVASAYVVPIAMAIDRGQPALLLPLLTGPMAAAAIITMYRRDGAQLNPCLPATARLLLWFALLFAGGIAW